MKKTALVLLAVFFISLAHASWECEWEEKKEEDIYSNENMNAALAGEISFGKIIGLSFLRVYHTFLSGRAGGQCVFYPGCSRYGFYAVKKYGLIKGSVMSTDRLFRCHGWSYAYDYPYDYKHSLLSDPVEANNTFNFIFDRINF